VKSHFSASHLLSIFTAAPLYYVLVHVQSSSHCESALQCFTSIFTAAPSYYVLAHVQSSYFFFYFLFIFLSPFVVFSEGG
jgi:hypothetical protein